MVSHTEGPRSRGPSIDSRYYNGVCFLRTTTSCSVAVFLTLAAVDSQARAFGCRSVASAHFQAGQSAPQQPPPGSQTPAPGQSGPASGVQPPGRVTTPAGQGQASTPLAKPAPPQEPPFLTSLWTATLPASPAARPGFDDTQSYIPLKDGHLVAVSLSTGKTNWTIEVQTSSMPLSGGDLLYVATDGAIDALVPADGSRRWKTPLAGSLSAPMVWDNGWLFVTTDRGDALALRSSDGQVLWRRELGAIVRSPLAPADERVYASIEDGRVVALDLNNGETVWERKLGGTPIDIVPLEDRLFVGSKDNFFYCLNLKSGKVKWRWRTGADIIGAASVDEAHVYFVSLDNLLRALDRGHGALKWQAPLSLRASTGPLPVDDLLLVAGISAEMRVYHAKDGKPAGQFAAADDLAAPPQVLPPREGVDFTLMILTRDGRVDVLERKTPPPTADTPAAAPSTGPATPGSSSAPPTAVPPSDPPPAIPGSTAPSQ